MLKSFSLVAIAALAMGLAFAGNARAAIDLSFTGNFTQDDDVQPFSFTADGVSNVTLRTWSYAGGVNAAGATIARGGFDPILALFDSTGAFINQNDDGGPSLVASDALSGQAWDTYFTAVLPAGTYTVTIMQYDNFAIGPNLSNGFARDGQGNFTTALTGFQGPFRDVSGSDPGNDRDGHWAFDILGVERAEVGTVPEPASMIVWSVIGLTVGGGAFLRRRKTA